MPDSLVDVVNRAMALEPGSRYATVSELADDIEAVLDGVPPPMAGESTILPLPDLGTKPQAPRPSPVQLAALVGVGVALALVVANLAPALADFGPVASLAFAVLALGLAWVPARQLLGLGK